MNTIQKSKLLQKRKWRIRQKVNGHRRATAPQRQFSGKHIYAQAIDDTKAVTLVFLSSVDPELRPKKLKANVGSAKVLGAAFAAKAKAAGISQVVFDRNGRPYHGKVKVFADAVREAGLKF